MTPQVVLDIFREAFFLIIMMVAVLIVPSLLVGLVVSMFQAATQINEQTLSFLPRLLTTLASIMIAGPWLLRELMDFTQRLAQNIPLLIG
jgi:flagellar biosynthetic protein FliQ